jgi:hypothetical protein
MSGKLVALDVSPAYDARAGNTVRGEEMEGTDANVPA